MVSAIALVSLLSSLLVANLSISILHDIIAAQYICVVIVALGATPSLLKLKTLKTRDGKPLKIIQTIAAGDYETFGMFLLQDENGAAVKVIKKGNIHDGPESVTQAILQHWLVTSDSSTRIYQHLIQCLRDSELGAL